MPQLVPWAQAIGVLILSLYAAFLGAWLSKRQFWFLIYIPAFFFIIFLVLARWSFNLALYPPFNFLLRGRGHHAFFAALISFAIAMRTWRIPTLGRQMPFWILLFGAVAYESVIPFLLPMFLHDHLANLQTTIDENGVCRQTTLYTCGPAAAVTALRCLGISSDESTLAVLMHTTPLAGTPPTILADTLQDRFAPQGLRADYRHFDSIDDLAGREPVLALTHMDPLVDHYVVVLQVTQDGVVEGDPYNGRLFVTREDFQRSWRNVGVIVSLGRANAN